MVKIEIKNQEKTLYEPIDIVYVPMKNKDDIINCYLTDHLYFAFRPHCSKGKKIESEIARQYFFCSNYFSGANKFKANIKCCSKIDGMVYKFENKNIVSFQGNFKYMGNLPFAVYFDYRTTTGDDVLTTTKCL